MTKPRYLAVLAASAALGACSATGAAPPPEPLPAGPKAPAPPAPNEETRITSQIDAGRLLRNTGLTLQWIDWNTRGSAVVRNEDGRWTLRGSQAQAGGPGRLFLDGRITEIGAGFFTFEGTIRIDDTPDIGRHCAATKPWHFAITQNRPYYRLREFEWCDGLTDYVDIHF